MIDKQAIERIRSINIEQVAESLGLNVSHHKSLCPFHQDSHPSLTFSRAKNTYRCFVCDAHGGTIDLVMNSQNWKFGEACQWLANEFGVALSGDDSHVEAKRLTPHSTLHTKHSSSITTPMVDTRHLAQLVCQPYLNDEARHFLFDERKLHPAVVKWLGISSISSPVPMSRDVRSSWFNAPSLLIPYRDMDGNLLSVQARYLGTSPTVGEPVEPPRFQFPKGSQCHIFNLQVLKLLKPSEPLYISEGVTDCMALLSAGHKAIAIPSATLLKPQDLKPLETCHLKLGTTFHMYPDQDAPGARLFLQLRDIFSTFKGESEGVFVHHQLPEDYKDFGQWWSSEGYPINPLTH